MKNKILISSITALMAMPASAGIFDGLFGLTDNKSNAQPTTAEQKNSGATTSSMNGSADSTDYTKILSQKMTAKQLFAQKGMYSTLSLAQSLAADAKAGKNGMFMDSMGAMTMDLGATLRLASRLAAPYLSYGALEKLMTSFSDNPMIMDSVTIDVPQVGMLNPQLNEDLLGVARFLVAMKASNMLVAESEKSLEAAKTRYSQIMKERDDKAADLGKAVFLVNGVNNLGDIKFKTASPLNQEYLKGFIGRTLDETLKDAQAKQLIDTELQYLYPGEYKSILAGEKEVATHYSEYAKTSVGTLSMLGFASVFLNSVIDMGNRSHAHQLLLVPMAKDGVIELVGIVKNVISALSRNDELVEGTFSMTVDGKTTSGIKASKVLKSLSDEQLNGFRNAMIGNESHSYLTQLDRQSNTYAADIMDRLVDRDSKEAFAKTALSMENPDTFSFKTAFVTSANAKTGKAKGIDAKRVKTRLYEENLETATDETDLVFGKLQTAVKKDITSLTNQDMRRIMMLGDQKQILVVGNAVVRMEQPGLQGLSEQYEMRTASTAKVTQDIGNAGGQAKQAKSAAAEKTATKSHKATGAAKLPPSTLVTK